MNVVYTNQFRNYNSIIGPELLDYELTCTLVFKKKIIWSILVKMNFYLHFTSLFVNKKHDIRTMQSIK